MKIKNGDHVIWSKRNLNHLKNDICVYSGFSGTVSDLQTDGSFIINGKRSTLIIPMCNRDYCYLIINGNEMIHRKIKDKSIENPKKWFQWFIPKNATS